MRKIALDTGYVTTVAGTGEQAAPWPEPGFARHAKLNSPWDVLVLDMSMPGRGGLDVLKDVRRERPEMRVLVLSMHPEDQFAVRMLKAGASGYLTKTCALQDLIQAAQSVASNRTYVTQKMLRVLVEQMVRNGQQRHDNLRRLARLTPREREVLFELSMGADNESIAKRFFISPQTARTHIQNLLTKLGLHSRLAAASFAMQAGVAEILDDLQTATSASDRSSTATRELDPSARKPNSPITGGMAETTARGS